MLKEERSSKEELMADKQSIERKSKEFIESQQRQMEELNQAKVRYYYNYISTVAPVCLCLTPKNIANSRLAGAHHLNYGISREESNLHTDDTRELAL